MVFIVYYFYKSTSICVNTGVPEKFVSEARLGLFCNSIVSLNRKFTIRTNLKGNKYVWIKKARLFVTSTNTHQKYVRKLTFQWHDSLNVCGAELTS